MLLSFCPWESLGFYLRNIPSQSTMAIIYGGGCVQITTAPGMLTLRGGARLHLCDVNKGALKQENSNSEHFLILGSSFAFSLP